MTGREVLFNLAKLIGPKLAVQIRAQFFKRAFYDSNLRHNFEPQGGAKVSQKYLVTFIVLPIKGKITRFFQHI